MQLRESINKARVVLSFYRSFALASVAVTAICVSFIWTSGLGAFGVTIWIKVLSGAAIVYLVDQMKQREYFYYFNMGFSKTTLWILTLTLDFVVFITATLVAGSLR